MKFKWLLLAATTTALITTVTSAVAEEIDKNFFIEYAYTNCFKIKKIGDEDKSANVLFLNYDDNGRLTSVDTTVITDFSKNYTYEEVGIDTSHINENTRMVIPGESGRWIWEGPEFEIPDNPEQVYTAMLNEIEYEDENYILYFAFSYDGIDKLVIPQEKEIKVYGLGEGCSILDINSWEVISIEYDIKAGIENSEYYNIYVSKCVLEGRIKEFISDDMTLQRWENGETYNSIYNGRLELNEKDAYTAYLDIFQRIAHIECLGDGSDLNAVNARIKGVLENLYQDDRGKYYASVINEYGETKTYPLAEKEKPEQFEEVLYADDNNKNFIAKRFIGYSLNSKDEIRLHGSVEMEYIPDVIYNSQDKKLGEISVNSYNAHYPDYIVDRIFDFTDYYVNDKYNEAGVISSRLKENGEYDFITEENLTDGESYNIYVFKGKYYYIFIMQD